MLVSARTSCAPVPLDLARSASAVTLHIRCTASTKRIAIKLADTGVVRRGKHPRDCQNLHERDLYAIRDLGDDWTLREEVEELFADNMRQGRDEDAERDHLGRQEHEREGIAISCAHDVSIALRL